MVEAGSAVQAWGVGAFIDVDLTLSSGEARHADASECSRVVQAASFILTWVRFTFVDVCFATGTGEALTAVASKRSRNVNANSVVFAGRTCWNKSRLVSIQTVSFNYHTLVAFVNVFRAVGTFVALCT